MKRFAPLLLLALLAATPAQLAPVPGKTVIALTAKPGYFSEPSVAIDPRNPRAVLAAYQVRGNVAFSRDAGRSWRIREAVPHDHRLIAGDVSVAFDARGRAVLCYIAFDKLGTENYWAHNATRNGIFVVRSRDGGMHWEKHAIAIKAPSDRPGIFEDKPYIVADDTNGPYRGNLYVGWTEFHLGYSQMLFSRSTDGGATWSRPIRISSVNGLPRDDNGAVEGFAGAVAPDGTLYVVWQDGAHIILTSSHDGGRSFERSQPVINVPSMNFSITGFLGRGGNGFPQIAIDPKSGRLFIAWSDYRNGEVDVFTAVSTDRGASWSDPVKANTDPVHNGRDHLFQWLAVDPVTGDAYLIFNDRRGDKSNEKATVTLARSTDGGHSYRDYAWTSVPYDPLGQFMGDYTGIAAYHNRVYGVWTEAAPTRSKPYTRDWMRPRTVVRLGIAQF